MDLADLSTDADARVVAVDLDHGMRLRLSELGLRVGARIRVTHRAAFGGRVVAIGADRFAVDARTCACIAVEPAHATVDRPGVDHAAALSGGTPASTAPVGERA